MTCTNFPKYNLVENVTQHQVGNVTYLYKGGAPTAPLWEAITGPLAAKAVTVEGGGSVQGFIDNLDQVYTRTFANVDAMLAFNGLFVGQSVKTLAFNAPHIQEWEIVPTGAGNLTDRTILLNNGLYAKITKGIHNVLSYGAYGDDSTDDKVAFDKAKIATNGQLLIPTPSVKYYIGGELDWSNSEVTGSGKNKCLIRFPSNYFGNCITSAGNTIIRSLNLDGGWDGSTPAQTGDLVNVSSPTFIAEFHMYDCVVNRAKQDAVSLSNIGYSSLTNIQSQITGRIGLHLGATGVGSTTSVKLFGKNRFSDCPHGFGLRVYNSHNCDFTGLICEYTAGIEIAGNNNRSLNFDSVYQEFGSFPEAYTFTGAGDGLSITNNFGGSKSIPSASNFINVTMYGNSNFSSIAPLQSNDLKVLQTPQCATPADTVQQSITTGSIPLGAGLWRVTSRMQTEDAGGAALDAVGLLVTLNVADSAFQTSTSSIAELAYSDIAVTSPAKSLVVHGYLSLSTPAVAYIRAGWKLSAGQIALSTKTTFERVK